MDCQTDQRQLKFKSVLYFVGGFDTHDNQLAIHKNKLTELNDAVFNFMKI
jgi:uncharacterized protein (DUF1501 family)